MRTAIADSFAQFRDYARPTFQGSRALQNGPLPATDTVKGARDSQPGGGTRSCLTPVLATCTAYRKMSTTMTMIIISPSRPPPIYMIKPFYADEKQHHSE